MFRVSPSSALIEKLPSKSVVTPVEVPSTTIVAPGKGIPSLSETTPIIV